MRRVKARAKLGARLVMSPRSASAVDQIACGCRKGQRPIVDEVNKLGRFDAEIHMRTSVSALAELMVRIHSPPADSLVSAGIRLSPSRSRAFPPVLRAGAASAVGGDGHDAAIWRQRPIISLSGPIPVPRRQ